MRLSIWLIFSCLIIISCNKDDNEISGDWLIPSDQVLDGGPGKDGIPALSNPRMINADAANYLNENDLVIGYYDGQEARAYPHAILDWHEIINDEVNDTFMAITYCPLTGTAINWNRIINGQETTFGVSGLLYNTNLIPYDRLTDSNWSQMKMECVNGSLIGEPIKTLPLLETTWKTWKELYPDTKVVSTNTGINRPYGSYPYINNAGEDYRVDPFIIFPISNDDNRLSRKERVLGLIINGEPRAYRFNTFEGDLALVNDQLGTVNIVVAGSKNLNFMVSFYRTHDGQTLNFGLLENQLPLIMTDQEGNTWDVFGRAVTGPREGEQLKRVEGFIGYWFAWATFFPEIEIFE